MKRNVTVSPAGSRSDTKRLVFRTAGPTCWHARPRRGRDRPPDARRRSGSSTIRSGSNRSENGGLARTTCRRGGTCRA